jgi:pseudoazurin
MNMTHAPEACFRRVVACVRSAFSWGHIIAAPLALAACDLPVRSPDDTVEQAPAQATMPEVEPNGRVIEIRMYTIDPEDSSRQHVFKPNLIAAEVGDTIRFLPTELSHQSSSIATMLPEGARGWEGAVNAEVSYVLPRPGIYGFECVPHYAAGMIGLVVVNGEGKTENLARTRAASHPGLATPEFAALFAQAQARGLLD